MELLEGEEEQVEAQLRQPIHDCKAASGWQQSANGMASERRLEGP